MGREAFFLREWQVVSGWQVLLRPLSWFYRLVINIRRSAFQRGWLRVDTVGVPVVIVGNIGVGGTGKTPVVLALCNHLQHMGRHPGVVTRGYIKNGGARPNALAMQVMSPRVNATSGEAIQAADSTQMAGDEALLLASRVQAPVYAGRNRVAAARKLLREHPTVDVVLCDDGLQHYALKRDLEIAVVDGVRGFGNGFCLPAGPLRESVARLYEVDCIVVNNTSKDGGFEAKVAENARPLGTLRDDFKPFGKPVFSMTYADERFQALKSREGAEVGEGTKGTEGGEAIALDAFIGLVAGKRIAAVAGIGNPDRFFRQLQNLGIKLASTHAFDDHHPYAVDDFRDITADIILMTEKDAVKCADFPDARLWMMQIDAQLPDAFYDFVLNRIRHVARPKAT